jgi:hypothetical protein
MAEFTKQRAELEAADSTDRRIAAAMQPRRRATPPHEPTEPEEPSDSSDVESSSEERGGGGGEGHIAGVDRLHRGRPAYLTVR